jgi:prepilin-type processing-associated H-X9-DG protein
VAAKNSIDTFLCASVPSGPRDPTSNYGGFDYMFVALSDVNSTPGDPLYGERQVPAGNPAWVAQVQDGCLNCADKGFERVTDGTSKTILCMEDAGRSHPDVARFGAYSSRDAVTGSGQADPVKKNNASGPAECPWQTNNCGPNDEPFAFHPTGLNLVMADGSVRFMSDSIDGVAVKWLVGARDAQATPDF